MTDTAITQERAGRDRLAALEVLQRHITNLRSRRAIAGLPPAVADELAEMEGNYQWLRDAPAFSVGPRDLYEWIGYTIMVGSAAAVISGVTYLRPDRSVAEVSVIRSERNTSTGAWYTRDVSVGRFNVPVTVYGDPVAMVIRNADGEVWRAVDHTDRRKMLAALWVTNDMRQETDRDPITVHLVAAPDATASPPHPIAAHLLEAAGRLALDEDTVRAWVKADEPTRLAWPFDPADPTQMCSLLDIGNQVAEPADDDDDDDDDPAGSTTLAWIFNNGAMDTGTIAEMGISIEHAGLAGYDLVRTYALTVDNRLAQVRPAFSTSPFDEDHYAERTMTITLPDGVEIETGWRVDGSV